MNSPTKQYRKKPVVIEAVQFNGGVDSYLEIVKWMEPNRGTMELGELVKFTTPIMIIQTLEGAMAANPGDWIIRGVKGEFYPCKPDVFAATYEPA